MKCFAPREITLKTPIWSKFDNQYINKVPVPCGKCAACIERRIREWTFRLDNERTNSAVCYFVTLTYDNYHVPINKYGKMTLEKQHVQQFLKKLRYERARNPDYGLFEKHYFKTDLTKENIKYFAVGEYGTKNPGKTGRPHYHLIMYNTSKTAIRECWEHGEVDIQIPRNSQALGYVIKYLSKRLKETTPKNINKEFSLMSKGIGLNYVKKMGGWHRRNPDVLYTANETMNKIPMSKFIRNQIFSKEEKELQIPIIKKNINETEKKERDQYGERYEEKKNNQRIHFDRKTRKRTRPRKNPGSN